MTREEKLAIYDSIVEMCPDFPRKGKTMPYTSANGYMFSQFNKDNQVGIRLPKDVREKFLEDHDSGPFLSYGAVMREYVLIPDSMLEEPERVAAILQTGYEYVMSLEPNKGKK